MSEHTKRSGVKCLGNSPGMDAEFKRMREGLPNETQVTRRGDPPGLAIPRYVYLRTLAGYVKNIFRLFSMKRPSKPRERFPLTTRPGQINYYLAEADEIEKNTRPGMQCKTRRKR